MVEDLGGVVGTAKKVIGSVSDIIPNPILTEKEKHEIIKEALDVPKLKEWSSNGWQFVGMDFVGKSKSAGDKVEWTRASVYLHLPDRAGNPPEECSQGWSATIDVDLETGKADRNSGYPTRSSHECKSKIVLEDPATAMGKEISKIFDFSSWFNGAKDSAAKPSFVIAEADDVVSNDVYGNTAYLKTPSYEHAVFDHMDSYIAHLLNQKWNTSPVQHMTQVGWLITAVEGCVDCGTGYIPKDSSALVLTDTSVFGNLEAHKIPFDWKPDKEISAKTACDDAKSCLVSIVYDGEIFNHNTNIPCENADNNSKISNSVFFENWNAVQSSSWAQDITGSVEAHSAYGFINSHSDLHVWTNSTNEQQSCDNGRDPTAIIEGSLSSGDAATWVGLDKVAPAC